MHRCSGDLRTDCTLVGSGRLSPPPAGCVHVYLIVVFHICFHVCSPQEVDNLEQELARGVAAADAARQRRRGGAKGEGGSEDEEEGKDSKEGLLEGEALLRLPLPLSL